MKCSLLIYILTVATCSCSNLPSGFKKCNRKQEDFNECLKAAVVDAVVKLNAPIREVGLVNLQPLDVPSLVIGAGTGAVAFQQNYKNIKLSGLKKVECEKVEMDLEKNKMVLECSAPQIKLDFDYEIHGKILLLPIYGKGPGWIILEKPKMILTFDFEEYKKKEKKHLKVSKKKMILTPERIQFKLDNLFDGDKTLGDNINQVLNDNWSEVYADVKASYEEAFAQIFAAIYNNLLGKVSVGELFGEE